MKKISNFLKSILIKEFLASFLFFVLFFSSGTHAQTQFFVKKGCLFCQQMQEYLRINFPNKKIKFLDIDEPENLKKFIACANRFRLNKIGTPLICGKKDYILGWGVQAEQKIKRFLPK